jgi:hypothetical protein
MWPAITAISGCVFLSSLPLPSSITPKLVFTSIRSERFGAHVNVFNLGKKKRN